MSFWDLEEKVQKLARNIPIRILPDENQLDLLLNEGQRSLDAEPSNLHKMIQRGGKLTGNGARLVGRKVGEAARYFWEHSDGNWLRVRGIVAGTATYSGLQAVSWSIDSAMDERLRPIIGGWLDGNVYGTLEYAVSILGTLAGLHIGNTVYRSYGRGGTMAKYVEVLERAIKKLVPKTNFSESYPDLEKKLKGTIGLTLIIPALIMFAAVRPRFVDDLRHRYFDTSSFSEIVQEATVIPGLPQLKRVREDLSRDADISPNRLKEDAEFLRKSGYGINEKDVYFLARAVAVEAGHYYKHGNFAERQRRDMRAVLDDTFTRLAVADQFDKLRSSFNDPREVSFENVLTARRLGLQYSSASRRNIRLWEEGYKQKQLLHGTRFNSERNKIKLAYMTIMESLYSISRNPYDDTTGGSTHFMNEDITGKSWHNVSNGDYKRVLRIRIEDHWHYILVDKAGTNIGEKYRVQYFATTKPQS